MHPVIKAGYKDPKFKYEADFTDPTGMSWQALKQFMRDKMEAADFKTLWKGVAQSVPICSKALTLKNIQSAFDATGAITRLGVAKVQRGETTDPSNALRILSGNAHFVSLDTATAQQVMDLLPQLTEAVATYDFVPEELFDTLLGAIPGADNAVPVEEGRKGLNDLAINRQRCCILGNSFFEYRKSQIERQASRKRAPAVAVEGNDAAVPAKAKRRHKCANIMYHEQSEPKSKCSASRCTFYFCDTPVCKTSLLLHQPDCVRAADAANAAKKETKAAAKTAK